MINTLILLIAALLGPDKASVTVVGAEGSGSGVVFKNGPYCFVWTAAHVVAGNRVIEEKLDPVTKEKKVYEYYKNCIVLQDIHEDGEKVGEVRLLASIIRYSEAGDGLDLALLYIHKLNAFPGGISFFDGIPTKGEDIIHVGSARGVDAGARNTLTKGNFSNSGRLRKHHKSNDYDNPRVYDQVSIDSQPGCSGGGVFRGKDGRCIGLVTEGIGSQVTFIVPSRVILKFAKRNLCLWAVDTHAKLPVGRDEAPINVVPIDPKKVKRVEVELPEFIPIIPLPKTKE